ncbi:MAG: DUF6629 family protein [Bacteroidota bacterium]
MCFSAEASFTAGAVLCIAGVFTVRKAANPSQKYFAAIPFIFAIQQITEGFVWLSFVSPAIAAWQVQATYFFLFFAQVFWPSWVPFALIMFEKDKKTKQLLIPFLIVGVFISVYLTYILFNYEVTPEIRKYHMYYNIHHPFKTRAFSGLIYLIPTVLSTMVSKTKGIWLFGLLNFMAWVVSKMFFNDHVLSVWCFLAAWISVIIYLILRSNSSSRLTISANRLKYTEDR